MFELSTCLAKVQEHERFISNMSNTPHQNTQSTYQTYAGYPFVTDVPRTYDVGYSRSSATPTSMAGTYGTQTHLSPSNTQSSRTPSIAPSSQFDERGFRVPEAPQPIREQSWSMTPFADQQRRSMSTMSSISSVSNAFARGDDRAGRPSESNSTVPRTRSRSPTSTSGSQPSQEGGKRRKGGSRSANCVWDEEDDRIIVDVLLEAKRLGEVADNSFKSAVYQRAADQCNKRLSKGSEKTALKIGEHYRYVSI